ncbi:hypothetical protein H1R20_g1527, partial [Candolleomyces eurysporus]
MPGLQLCRLPHRPNTDTNPSLFLRMPPMWLRNTNLNTNDRASDPDSAYATDDVPS